MYDFYTDEDEELIEAQAELMDFEIELNDGQDIMESLMFHGFDR